MFKNVSEATEALISRRKPTTLKQFKAILDLLEIPYNKVPCIHVTGTNGKGSTVNYMMHILKAANYRVGTFTSPYILCHQDRFCINGQMMDDGDFLDLMNRYYPVIEKYGLSMFEADVLLAFVYFYEQNVDVALIEVGIGGREDKTNLMTPLASVITNVGHDHLQKLGPTLRDVAYQKAGIIKTGRPVFIGEMSEDLMTVIAGEANKLHAPLHITHPPKKAKMPFAYGKCLSLDLGEVASYQIKNVCLAIDVIESLYPKITPSTIQEGVYAVNWPGRFEHFQYLGKDLYLDGAHNPHAFQALFASIEEIRNHREVSVIYAALSDKEYQTMAEMIVSQGYHLMVCQFEDERALTQKQADSINATRYFSGIEEALAHLKEYQGMVIVCGSLHFISQFRQIIVQRLNQLC